MDGSKVGGNAARERTYDADGLKRLLERAEAAIAGLEAQNQTSGAETPARLPQALRRQEALRDQVKAALAQVAEDGRVNLTDADAVLLKGRHGGYLAGYNAQAVVSPVKAGGDDKRFLITAAGVSQAADDHAELIGMLEASEANLGQRAEITLADAGYHSGENLARCAERGQTVLMPEAQAKALHSPYHKDAFHYDAATDTYTCPQGQTLRYTGPRRDRKGRETRLYRASAAACRACPAFGACTRDRRHGRALEVGPDEEVLKSHRALMASSEAKDLYRRRKELIEPAFGILKEQQGARRFLLRGLENTRTEWLLLCAAFNLRVLVRVWRSRINGLAAVA